MRSRGLALVVMVGVLGVMAVLATAFVTMARLERRASLQRTHGAKALLLARSGIEDALARLAAGQDPEAPASRYGGEDWDDDGSVTGLEAAAEAFQPGRGNRGDCPARQALRPSFFARSSADLDFGGNRAPDRLRVDGRERGYTGALSGDLTVLGNHWTLLVEADDGIHVNGGDLSSAGEHAGSYDVTLRRILGHLAEELDASPLPVGDGIAGNALPVGRADGEALVALRPAGGWVSWGQLRDGALGGSAVKLASLKPYLALSAWVDRKVIRPNALPALEGAHPKGWAEIRRGASDDPDPAKGGFSGGRSQAVPVFEARAPVSLAWARDHPPAAVALLRGLKGLWLDERDARCDDAYSSLGYTWPSEAARMGSIGTLCSAEIGWAEARNVAARLASCTSDLGSWQSFQDFCDTLASDAGTGLTASTADELQAKRDLLKANFNPNSDLNQFNPNPSLWKKVGKTDLLAYSAEFSLVPLGRRVTAVGRTLDASGRVLACREFRASVSPPGLVRLTTQREFACEALGDPAVAGDEGPPRLPGQAGVRYISRSRGPGTRTWGHALGQPALGDSGAGLQTYPEPCVNAGAGLSLSPADYDGNLQLATVETARDDYYHISATTQLMMGLARYDDGFDLDVAGGDAACQADTLQVQTAELGLGLLDAVRPNTLHPDGAYAERGRTPAYLDSGNAHGFVGVLAFWIKPSFDILKSTGFEGTIQSNLRLLGRRGHRYVNWSNGGEDATGGNGQFFFLGSAAEILHPSIAASPSRIVAHFERGGSGSENTIEHQFTTSQRILSPHQWYHLCMYYNFRADALSYPSSYEDNTAGIMVDQGTGPLYSGPNRAARNSYYCTGDGSSLAQSIVAPGHRITLGKPASVTYCAGSPDATFDEFALYHFDKGSDGFPANYGAPQSVWLGYYRHQAGRYYKGAAHCPVSLSAAWVDDEAGSLVTAPLRLPAGSVLRQVAWTWYRPSALPDDYAEIELLDADGTAYLWDPALSRSTLAPAWTADRQAWTVERPLPDAPFRARVVFRRRTAVGSSTPILDSPVFDDLSFVTLPPGGPRIVAWEGG